jgi:hypothetical protein
MRGHAVSPEPPAGVRDALASVEEALLDLAEGTHAFDRETKLAAFRSARRRFSRAVGFLLRASPEVPSEPIVQWVVAIETTVLSSLAGLLRWVKRLEATP